MDFTWERIPQLKSMGGLYSSGEKGEEMNFGDLVVEPVHLPQQEGQYELNLEMGGTDSQERLFGFFKYNTDLFEEDTIANMAASYQVILQDIVDHPDKETGRLNILSKEQKAIISEHSHPNEVVYPQNCTIHSLIEKQAANTEFTQVKNSENPSIIQSSESNAYMIYTSGSTGKPKGVMVPHRAVVNFLCSMQKKPGLTINDKLLAVTSISFDISVLELFLPLIAGATVEICEAQTAKDGISLAKRINDHVITVMQATPSTWKMLIDADWQGKQDLKILCGGEQLSSSLANALVPKCRALWNMYGPTETTVWSSVAHISTPDDITIGKPINNTGMIVLDNQCQPVPVGVPGTLYISGDGLTNGYHNRKELTTEKFNPITVDSGITNFYNTGDLIRMRSDGMIEYLGRKDKQVKLRGFRIELDEITTLLSSHEAIAEAIALVTSNDNNGKLVAYYTLNALNHSPAVSELKDYLRKKLPEYMVPSVFIKTETFPLLPNGKIAMDQLPKPEIDRTNDDIVQARDRVEHELVKIWEETLKVAPIGITDNFFDLGGHSLLGVILMNEIEKQLLYNDF